MRIPHRGLLIAFLCLCLGCERRASHAKTGRDAPAPVPANTRQKQIRSVPVLETVEPEEFAAAPETSVHPVDTPARFRPPDRRPQHDDEKLAQAGIHRYESQRLILYTDIDGNVAKTLPPVVDQLYDALVRYFGPLPPDEPGTEFQMTGYLIRDEVLYREAGLLEDLATLFHGKHLANRFWLREQQHEYFRRHLLLHECVHCYMTFVPGTMPPVWYMEGMAELFATHRLKPDGTAEFGILPGSHDDLGGWGRITAIRTLCAEGKSHSIREVCNLPHEAFFQPQAYAWSWGLCCFFDNHPGFRERFRELAQHLTDGRFSPTFHELFAGEERNLSTEWKLFEHQLQTGYDLDRAAIAFQAASPLTDGEQRVVSIRADRGWQDLGLPVAAGERYEIKATGRFLLGDDPKPWISEPQGISIDYFNGSPLGRLMACLDVEREPVTDGQKTGTEIHVLAVGKSATWTVPANGRLLLRLNDAWDSLADNAGEATVTIRRLVALEE